MTDEQIELCIQRLADRGILVESYTKWANGQVSFDTEITLEQLRIAEQIINGVLDGE